MTKFTSFFKTAGRLLKNTFKKFREDEPVVYSAAIAFFTIFSLPSVLIIIVNISKLFTKERTIEAELEGQVESLVGPESARQIVEVLENAGQQSTSVLANIISIFIVLFTSTVVFSFLQKALNDIWGVRPKPKKEVLKFGMDRLLSFSIILVFIFFMLVSLIIDAIISFLKNYVQDISQNLNYINDLTVLAIQGVNFLISLVVVSVIFGFIFKVLPDVHIKWKDVRMGAIITGVLFTIGKYLIGLFLSNSNITSTYGAAGSLVGILLWVFYSTIIVMIGGEFTQVYAQERGRNIKPNKHSVKVIRTEEKVEEGV